MILKLQRIQTITQTTRGRLSINGEFFCDTIENTDHLIPTGFYPVRVTYSPRFDELLPLLDNVPGNPSIQGRDRGRLGIRIHPGNTARDSSGCILVGQWDDTSLPSGHLATSPSRLLSSRQTFNTLREQLLAAQHNREPICIDIVDASPHLLRQNRIYDNATLRK